MLAQVALIVAFPAAGFSTGRAATGLFLSLILSALVGIGFAKLIKRSTRAGRLGSVLLLSFFLVVANYLVFGASWFTAAEIFAPDRSLVYEPVLGFIMALFVLMVYSGWVGFPAGLLAGYFYYRKHKPAEEQ